MVERAATKRPPITHKGFIAMKLLVLGATGPTGRHFLDIALDAGDAVTAFARNPAALAEYGDRLAVASGDATAHADVAAALAGQDAIVVALGRAASTRADGLFSRAAAAVISAAKESGVKRLVWLSSFGVGDSYRQASTTQKLIYRTLLRDIYADKRLAEEELQSSGLDWTIVYPTRLTHGPAAGRFKTGDRLPMRGNPTVSRADTAAFMHQTLHGTEWIGRSPIVTD
ncbi:NAD(P)-dependent oxidoreductase [Glycomyces sp. NPDC048151]|uniref:NAD(P)-dependent oxidoreductase n=1 Tax=Glycomyces sp. NPDC048151 TaxID=3364002 RepID=UPI00370FBE07